MSKQIQGEVKSIVRSILEEEDPSAQRPAPQPDKQVIIALIEKLQCVVFPRHFAHSKMQDVNSPYQLGALLEDIFENLSEQTALALLYAPEYENAGRKERRAAAEQLIQQFLGTIPAIRAAMKLDVEAAYDGDPAAYNRDEVIFCYPGLYAIMVNRLAHELFLRKIPLIPRIMTEHAHSLTGIDIHPGATIGRYFFIDHGTGVVIGETTTIGDRVKIYQGVTLGALSTRAGQGLRNKKRHPTIEDDVTIYSGASILGGETVIGRDTIIGGNSFITTSIPPHSRVSIRNPELQIKSDSSLREETMELDQGPDWYVI